MSSGKILIMLKHNHHNLKTFALGLSGCYNSVTAAKQNLILNNVRVKSPTKANTDRHNSDIKIYFLLW